MAVRDHAIIGPFTHSIAVAATALALGAAGCAPSTAPSPTPPPGFTIEPKAQVVAALDPKARASWHQVEPGVRAIVLASTSSSIVDIVTYQRSDAIIDPYKDNFRLIIDGTGACTVEQTRIPVVPGDLVVAPMGVARSCAARSGNLVLLTISLPRGQNLAGVPDRGPTAGRINVAGLFAKLPPSNGDAAYLPLYQSDCCTVLAGWIRRTNLLYKNDDEFVYVFAGTGSARIGRLRETLRPGDLAVVPAGTAFSFSPTGPPIRALVVRASRGTGGP